MNNLNNNLIKTKSEKLKSLLCSDYPEKNFQEIAFLLFEDFHIEKGNTRYDFLEIEFYYCHKPDGITYRRTCPAGSWFLHYSGVDIAFESDESKGYYGGILIRSLLKNEMRVIAGPLKCSCELFNNLFHIDGQANSLCLVENQEGKNDVKIEWTKRYRITTEEPYCAYVRERKQCHPDWKDGNRSYHAKPWERSNQSIRTIGNNTFVSN